MCVLRCSSVQAIIQQAKKKMRAERVWTSLQENTTSCACHFLLIPDFFTETTQMSFLAVKEP